MVKLRSTTDFETSCSYEAIIQCWKEHPDKRPTFSELVHTISGLLTGIANYLDFSTQPAKESDVPLEDNYDHQAKVAGHGYDQLAALEADKGSEKALTQA